MKKFIFKISQRLSIKSIKHIYSMAFVNSSPNTKSIKCYFSNLFAKENIKKNPADCNCGVYLPCRMSQYVYELINPL